MKGVILSGGKGTRLRPFTYTGAKQLVPVANKPILFYCLEDMKRFGIQEVVIIVGDTKDEIMAAVGNGEQWGLDVSYIEQDEPRGLAHATWLAKDFIGKNKFLVILGDNFVEEDLTPVMHRFEGDDSLSAMSITIPVPDPQRFGVVEVDGDLVTAHVEKPKNPTSNLIGIGYYLLNWPCFDVFDRGMAQTSERGEYEISLFYNYFIEKGDKVGYHVLNKAWVDTGKMEDMLEANRIVLQKLETNHERQVPDRRSQKLETDIQGKVDGRSVLKGPVVVGHNTQIVNSEIVGPVIIGDNCFIQNVYLGPFTSIYHNVELNDCEITDSVLLENVRVDGVETRIENSLIGRNVQLRKRTNRPKTLQLRLGDHSIVEVP